MYVFDTSPLIHIFNNFYESRFPTFWENLNEIISDERIISVREVYNEIIRGHTSSKLVVWTKNNKDFFPQPSEAEIDYVKDIFNNSHFRQVINNEQILKGSPSADPFVVAKARFLKCCVVTQERHRPNAPKIPNICEEFGIECINLEGFMERENLEY